MMQSSNVAVQGPSVTEAVPPKGNSKTKTGGGGAFADALNERSSALEASRTAEPTENAKPRDNASPAANDEQSESPPSGREAERRDSGASSVDDGAKADAKTQDDGAKADAEAQAAGADSTEDGGEAGDGGKTLPPETAEKAGETEKQSGSQAVPSDETTPETQVERVDPSDAVAQAEAPEQTDDGEKADAGKLNAAAGELQTEDDTDGTKHAELTTADGAEAQPRTVDAQDSTDETTAAKEAEHADASPGSPGTVHSESAEGEGPLAEAGQAATHVQQDADRSKTDGNTFGKTVSRLAQDPSGKAEGGESLGRTVSALAKENGSGEGKSGEKGADRGPDSFLENIRLSGKQLREGAAAGDSPAAKEKADLDALLKSFRSGQVAAAPRDGGTPAATASVTAGHAQAQPSTPSSTFVQNMANLSLNTPVNQKGWEQGFGERVVWMVKEGMQEAQLQLRPRHLGSIEVRISMHHDQASVSFVAQNAQTRDAIESAMPRLREMMGEQGLDLARSDVSEQSPGRQQAGGEGGDSARGDGNAALAGNETEESGNEGGLTTGLPPGFLDYYA